MHYTPKQLTLEMGRYDRDTSAPGVSAARLAAVTRLLPAEERRLIELLFVHNLSHRAAAAELKLAPGVVSRRIQRLRNMLASPTIRAIAENLDSLAPEIRQVAVDHYFNRIGLKLLCERTGATRRAMQSRLDFIRGWARALHRAAVMTPRFDRDTSDEDELDDGPEVAHERECERAYGRD